MQLPRQTSARLLWLAEMTRLNERLREFSAEVRRQEDCLRALYPRVAQAFRRPPSGTPDETGANTPH